MRRALLLLTWRSVGTLALYLAGAAFAIPFVVVRACAGALHAGEVLDALMALGFALGTATAAVMVRLPRELAWASAASITRFAFLRALGVAIAIQWPLLLHQRRLVAASHLALFVGAMIVLFFCFIPIIGANEPAVIRLMVASGLSALFSEPTGSGSVPC